MTVDNLKELISCGHELELKYNEVMFSITYVLKDGIYLISVCEFYKESIEVKTIEELLELNLNGIVFKEIWESLTEDDLWIY